MTRNGNSGHGHVYPRSDGVLARCGGPAMCSDCALDQAQKLADERKREADKRAWLDDDADTSPLTPDDLCPDGTD